MALIPFVERQKPLNGVAPLPHPCPKGGPMSDCVALNYDRLVAKYGLVLSPDQAAEAVAAAIDGAALLEQVNRGRFPVKPKPTRPRGFVAYDLAQYLCGVYQCCSAQDEGEPLTTAPVVKSKAKSKIGITQSVAARVKERRERLGITTFAVRHVHGWQARQALRTKLREARRVVAKTPWGKSEAELAQEAAELEELSIRAYVALTTKLRFRRRSD